MIEHRVRPIEVALVALVWLLCLLLLMVATTPAGAITMNDYWYGEIPMPEPDLPWWQDAWNHWVKTNAGPGPIDWFWWLRK